MVATSAVREVGAQGSCLQSVRGMRGHGVTVNSLPFPFGFPGHIEFHFGNLRNCATELCRSKECGEARRGVGRRGELPHT